MRDVEIPSKKETRKERKTSRRGRGHRKKTNEEDRQTSWSFATLCEEIQASTAFAEVARQICLTSRGHGLVSVPYGWLCPPQIPIHSVLWGIEQSKAVIVLTYIKRNEKSHVVTNVQKLNKRKHRIAHRQEKTIAHIHRTDFDLCKHNVPIWARGGGPSYDRVRSNATAECQDRACTGASSYTVSDPDISLNGGKKNKNNKEGDSEERTR